jgi:hypothetical protein
MPLWLGAGLAGWYLHRRTRIQDTAAPQLMPDRGPGAPALQPKISFR